VAIPLTTATNHKHYDWLLGGGGDPSAAAEGEGEEAVCGEEENPTAIADHLQLQQQQQFYLVTGIMPLSEIVTDTARKRYI
jgi:hypothetical protein